VSEEAILEPRLVSVTRPGWERRLELDAIREQRARPLSSRALLWSINTGLDLFRIRAAGERHALQMGLTELDLECPGLPRAFDGFTILHLSDFHFDGRPGFIEAIQELIRPVQADVCLMTGDYRFRHHGPCDLARESMAAVLECIETSHGVMGILGNHDPGRMLFQMESLGIEMLFNENAEIEREGESIWILGVDDPHHFQNHDLEAAHAGVPEGAFRILLAHTPELYREASARGIDVYLAGHSHGGQLCLPWWGAVRVNTRSPRRFCDGYWRFKGVQGYTTRGLGATDIPVRFNCPPDAALIRLVRP